ncbi:Fucosyl transferase [Aphelenchoides besseyi]|nr:Fucosyl transferase [Aphelenchoides besseyi]
MTMNQMRNPILFVIAFFIGCGLYIDNWHVNQLSFHYLKRLFLFETEKPIVLFWTNFWGNEFNLSTIFHTNSNCPYSCLFTYNKIYAQVAAIRILHQHDYNNNWLPPVNPQALNAFLMMESPDNAMIYGDSLFRADYFNITISYRSTSTVYLPYNEFVRRDGSETAGQIWTSEQIEKSVANKKTVFASISNCRAVTSARTEFIDELNKYVNVTKVGLCYGQRVDDQMMKKLVDEHYFTLAFENSVCPEYTTEKYWRLKELVVPVIFSRSVLNPNQVLNGTFLAASDFESPRELAEFLQTLIEDKQKYMNYFEWTKNYRRTMNGNLVNGIAVTNSNAGCQLCRLATLRPKLPPQNIRSFWNKSECIHQFGVELIKQTDYYKRSQVQVTELLKQTTQNRSAHGNLTELSI